MNDPKLELAMARLLPDVIEINNHLSYPRFYWLGGYVRLREPEWDRVMRMVEQTLTYEQKIEYMTLFNAGPHFGPAIPYMDADFNERAAKMCKLKGIEI